MKKLTDTQAELLAQINRGDKLTAYRSLTRFVLNVGTKKAKLVRAATVVPMLVASKYLTATPTTHGHDIDLA